jgi:hypothetical protein
MVFNTMQGSTRCRVRASPRMQANTAQGSATNLEGAVIAGSALSQAGDVGIEAGRAQGALQLALLAVGRAFGAWCARLASGGVGLADITAATKAKEGSLSPTASKSCTSNCLRAARQSLLLLLLLPLLLLPLLLTTGCKRSWPAREPRSLHQVCGRSNMDCTICKIQLTARMQQHCADATAVYLCCTQRLGTGAICSKEKPTSGAESAGGLADLVCMCSRGCKGEHQHDDIECSC